MFETGLQLFAEAVSGKKIVYLYRLAEKAKQEAAKNLAFTTENGRTFSFSSSSFSIMTSAD